MTAHKVERTAEVMRMVARGFTQAQIGEHFGVARETIKDIVSRERAKHPVNRQLEIETQADILDHLIREAMAVVEMAPAPVTAGKDGAPVRDPESGEWVRDHSGRLAAMATVRSLIERKAKLLGLDSATKAEMIASITYQVEGVAAPEDIG